MTRGMAMYRSLEKNSSVPILLYVLLMDEESYRALSAVKCENIILIHLENDFLNDELRTARSNRTWSEFCWACSSFLVKYIFNQPDTDQITYLDADIYFFNDPEKIFLEFDASKTALITEHYYHDDHDQSATNGFFCVQFVTINNNIEGKKLVDDWYLKCLANTSSDVAKGVFGDQKYLDEWPNDFQGIVITKNRGVGLAPWNLERFKVFSQNGPLLVSEGKKFYEVIFYHFHGLKIYESNLVELTGDRYKLSWQSFYFLYKPYFLALEAEKIFFKKFGYMLDHALIKQSTARSPFIAKIKSMIDGNWNRIKHFV
jgi:hypothetical protein